MGPSSTPNSQLRFGFDNTGAPVPHIYSLDPNLNPAENDTRKRIWRLTGGSSWTSVMSTEALDNVTVNDFAVGANNDVYGTLSSFYLSIIPDSFQCSYLLLSGNSNFADDKFPPEQYVHKAAANAQWAPVAQGWHLRDSNNKPFKAGKHKIREYTYESESNVSFFILRYCSSSLV
jgi:hypothetical protein